ncbi:MAG: sulfite exporter TauE/SafE family protein [Bacteroidota bacterium]
MEILLPLFAGLTLGCIHAFDADHLVAVTAFASKPSSGKRLDGRAAARFGLLWGLGHTATLLVLGTLSIAFRFIIPPMVESIAEVAVGILLISIGVWVLRDLLMKKNLHIHKHTHDGVEHIHLHSHRHGGDHRHQHSMFWVGATHGFAGTAAVMVIIPLAITESVITAAIYLLLFGVGTVCAMSFFAYTVGTIAAHAHSRNALPLVQALSGVASISVGLLWMSEKLL